jgi:hypothetical protein
VAAEQSLASSSGVSAIQPAQHARHPLLDVAIVADAPGGDVDREVTGERVAAS